MTGDEGLQIRRGTVADAASLACFGEEAFRARFAAENSAEDLKLYLASAFGEAIQRGELSDPALTYLIAERAGAVAGYVLLREGEPESCVPDRNAIEIARLYAAPHLLGHGVGSALMQRSLDEAKARGRSTIWLGVWERNARAIAFYERCGFRDVGSHPFLLGKDLQTDRIFARPVVLDAPRP